MQLTTASEVIRFVGELEDTAAKFYEKLAKKYLKGEETFLSLAKENRKNKVLVQRVYNEVVTDALETGFSFEGLNIDEHILEGAVVEEASLSDAAQRALDIEEKIQKFYLNAAKMSKSLLADIPRAFERIGKKRDKHKEKLKSLL
ncbi:unnamed protein product [marine sediment metagenome]|uniref:Rubrerythrin diiron-binding domain-containing protein n=1 Tax=marine sediment metagenome TaxID=412755 RepID=X1ST99_9ZZZZ